jgi:hypothetical protein
MRRHFGGWGLGTDSANIGLRHAWNSSEVEVETDTYAGRDEDEDRRALSNWLSNHVALNQERSLQFPVRLEVDRRYVDVTVVGRSQRFALIGSPERWFGYARIGDRTVRVDSRNCAPESLEIVPVDASDYSDYS